MRTDPSAAPGAETEGRADALDGTARPSLRDRRLCDKPSRPEAATQAAWSRTVFPYALPTRFQFTLNQDIPLASLAEQCQGQKGSDEHEEMPMKVAKCSLCY